MRLVATRRGDTATVEARNPAIDMLLTQIRLDGNAQEMAKRLTASLLGSETTVMEYDLRQASDMQGGVIVNMLFMWFLHFKLEKVQPLLIQVLMGFFQLGCSPLFQVYVSGSFDRKLLRCCLILTSAKVLGRNLERPFKTAKSLIRTPPIADGASSPSVAEDATVSDDDVPETAGYHSQ